MATTEFKSPKRKLVRFFQSSRDGWKRKYKESKRRNKQLANQARAAEKSRAHWKEIAKGEQRRARELERQLEELKRVVC